MKVYAKHHKGFTFPGYVYEPRSIQTPIGHFDDSALRNRNWDYVAVTTHDRQRRSLHSERLSAALG